MRPSNFQTHVVPADVLIIGGSLAGLTAAVKIKQLQAHLNVVVADKGGIGWAGCVPTGGGHLIIIPPDVDLDEWVKWVTVVEVSTLPVLFKWPLPIS